MKINTIVFAFHFHFHFHCDFWLIAILQFNGSFVRILNRFKTVILRKCTWIENAFAISIHYHSVSLSLCLSCSIKRLVCFNIENYWIWFANHLNRFRHISSPLGIGKSTFWCWLSKERTSERMNEWTDGRIAEWKWYANKRYCTYIVMVSWALWRDVEFSECKVGHWAPSVIMSRENQEIEFVLPLKPCKHTLNSLKI